MTATSPPGFRAAITALAAVLLVLQGLLISAVPAAAAGGPRAAGTIATGTLERSRSDSAAPRPGPQAAKPAYIYTCFWKKQAVTLTPVKTTHVDKLHDAKRTGTCARFDTADPRLQALVGKGVKVYTAPAEFKTSLVAFVPKKGKSTASGTWTFSSQAVIVKKTTDVLPASTVMAMTPPAGGKPLDTTAPDLSLTFPASDPRAKSLKLGSVIVSGVTPLTPYGLMRKVTSVTQKPNLITVETTPAQLSDVFNEATIDIHTALTQAIMAGLARQRNPDIHVDRLHDRLSLCPSFPSIQVSSNGVQEGASSGGLGAVTLGGSLCVTAGNLQYQEYVSKVRPRFGFTFDGGENLHVTYKLEGGVVAYSGDLATFLDQDVGLIPLEEFGVPVEIVPHITSKLSAALNLSGYVQGGFSYNGTYTAGLSCGVTGCSPASSNDGGFSSDPSLSGGTASFTVSLGIGLSFLVDGVFGPGIGASAYVTATSAGGEMNCLSLVAGAKATVSLNFQLFGKYKWVGSWDLFKFEKPLAITGDTCAPKIASFKADQPSPVEAGREVTFTAMANRAVDVGNFHITIIDAITGQAVQPDCTTGDTCVYKDTEAAAADRIFKAEITDAQGGILDTSDPVQMTWQGSGVIIGTSSPSQIPVGGDATLTVTANNVHTAHWFLNLFEDGTAIDGCADQNQCSFKVHHDQAGVHTYTANLQDGVDTKVIASTDAADAIKIEWISSTLELAVSPNRSDFVTGHSAALTLTADPGADGTTTFLKIVGSDGSTVAECNSGGTCKGNATSNTVGTVTYTGEIVDAQGNKIQSKSLTLNWIKFTVNFSLYQVTSSTVPVGKQVYFAISATPNVPGYTLTFTGFGQTQKCAALTGCTNIWARSATAQTASFSAQVIDNDTGEVVSDVATQDVTWVAWTFTINVNPGTTVSVGTQVTITMSAAPVDPDFQMVIAGGGGSYTCPTLTNCSSVVTSPTAQTITYTIAVQDKASQTTWASQQLMIAWQGMDPCPDAALACLILNPSSGGPSSTFQAIWYDQNAPDATVNFAVDGTTVSGGPFQMDGNGQSIVNITLNNASAGPHTVSAIDSLGGNGSNTYTVTGGGGGGGGTCGGISITMSADNTNPPAGQSVTLSVSGPTLPNGCVVKMESAGNGYVYNTCTGDDTSTGNCYVQVPYTDAFGNTGCPQEGQSGGTCTYQSFVEVAGDSNPADAKSSSNPVTITWQ